MGFKRLRYFVDTGAFYAGKDTSDQHYDQANIFMEKVRRSAYSDLITSNFIIDETITLIRMKLGHNAAVKFGRQIRESSIVSVINVNENIEDKAWKIFEKYSDKDFSFTDCTSFAIVEIEKIRNVFTFDKHFAQCGFDIVP